MSALFPSLFEEVLFWIVFLSGFATVPVVFRRAGGFRLPDKKKGAESRIVDPLFLFLFVIPIVIGYTRIGVLPSYLFYPGLAFWIVGTAIADWGTLTLGRFHSRFVRVVTGHRVIQKGPYRFVRHPISAGTILAGIGLGLALQSWVALLFILVGAGILYSNRIRIEERFLTLELGDEYVQYMKRVKRIIPYIL